MTKQIKLLTVTTAILMLSATLAQAAPSIVPDGNILTSLMKQFTSITSLSTGLIKGYALKVLITLIAIDLTVAGIIILIEDAPIGQTVIRRTIKYGAFAFMVLFYKDIINAFGDSFVLIGLKAAGSTLTAALFTNPSQITDMGFDMIMPLMDNMANGKGFGAEGGDLIDKVMSLPSTMMLGLTYILILFCFFAIAINIFIVYIEFAILTSIGLILVPFGVWDKTEFIFDKIKNGIITFGIKFMTLAFVVSISFNMIKSWKLPPDPTFQQALYVLVGMLAITYLCHHAPSVAAGIASGGGGSMTGAAMGGFVGGAAGNVGKVAGGLKTAATSTAGVAGAATKAGGGLAHKAVGAINPGMAASMSNIANQLRGGVKDGGLKQTGTSSAIPLAASGVNLTGATGAKGVGTKGDVGIGSIGEKGKIGENGINSSVQDALAKTASGTDLNSSTSSTASNPSTTPPAAATVSGAAPTAPASIAPSGVNIPPTTPNTNSTTV